MTEIDGKKILAEFQVQEAKRQLSLNTKRSAFRHLNLQITTAFFLLSLLFYWYSPEKIGIPIFFIGVSSLLIAVLRLLTELFDDIREIKDILKK